MRLLLDTHALLWWWTDDAQLSARARDAISSPGNDVLVSAATAWELATKHRIGKLGEAGEAVARFDELVTADGFQHLPLRKDVSIVLDPERPVNSFCLPAGPYREPRGAGRRKADLLLPNDQFSVQPFIRDIQWTQAPVAAPARVATLTAIAYPHRMVMTAEHLGYEVVSGVARPDHDPLDDPQLLSRIPADLPILTTAKDWVKLRQRPDVESRAWGILQYGVTIEPAAEFSQWLSARIHAK